MLAQWCSTKSGNLPWNSTIRQRASIFPGPSIKFSFSIHEYAYICSENSITWKTYSEYMPRYAQLVVGPAGSGKSTYCKLIQVKRHFNVFD